MRKQTKVVAVASAAALLAIGASMTSFAATGWVEEDGVWYWYDKDGNRVEDEWKKSGENWYWLDSEEGGAMATDKLIDDDDDTYYVDANGAMVKNTWVKVVNEDQDDEEDPAEYVYYYMQSNGKAYKAGTNTTTRFKTIDGKRYAFDEDGKMLYGWVNGDAERLTDEDDWANPNEDVYYLGSWEDGAMKTGWQKITVHDEQEDDDMDYWFYFKSNGKRFYNNETIKSNIKTKKINGKKYGFDDRGVMVYEWMISSTSDTATSADAWQYFRSPEDGARVAKGWFKVVAPNEDNTFNSETYGGSFAATHADDEEEKWYYADGDGELYHSAIKKIKGKYYAFRPNDGEKGAAMLSGLVLMKVDDQGNIVGIQDDNVEADELDDILDGTTDVADGYSLYYFGNDADSDGAMKTGSTTVNLDGESYQFMFSKTGGAEGKGKGLTGIYDEKYVYMYGCKLKASSDDKYIVVYANGDTGSGTADVEKLDSKDIRNADIAGLAQSSGTNKDGDTVKGITGFGEHHLLLNTSGAIVKNKTAAKDGDDWYFYVKKNVIKQYTNNKSLKGTKFDNWNTAE